jgi:glycerol kinase
MNTGLNRKESPSGSLLTTLAYKLGPDAPAVYALEGSVASAGRSVIWAKENLRIGDDLDEFNQYASSVPNTCGVTFVPAFSGLFAPYWRDDARAVIVGMSLRANFRHIARAIVEATALQCADVVNVLKKEGDIEDNFHSIVTDGGMTKSDLLMQIQSDLINTVIMRNRMTESTAFGAAYAAGLAIGFWETKPSQNPIISLIESQPGADIFMPQMTLEERDKIFARWNDAVERSFDLAQFNNQSF